MVFEHRAISAALSALAALAALPLASAQSFPSKPLRLISPYPPGGGNDTLLRTISPKLSEAIHQQVIVENRPGANTIIGTEVAVRAPADGYTLVLEPNTLAINPYLYPKLPYEVKDLAPVTLVGTSPLVVAVHPSLPAKDVRALIALARTRPGQVQYGSSGNGSVGHMAVSLLELMTGAKYQHIPYKGTAPMLVDVMSGQLTFTFSSALGVMPHVKTGRLRAIAVTSEKRSPALPELPTVGETVPGYSFILWYGLMVPAATPPDIIAKLNADIHKALNDPDIRAKLGSQGVDATPSTPREFADLIASDLKKFAKVVPQSGAKAE